MSGSPPYVELHAHCAYSFLDGASLPEEILARAAELGYGAIALTDHDSVAGAMELAMAARDSPVRAIFGAEITVREQAGDGGRQTRGSGSQTGDGAGQARDSGSQARSSGSQARGSQTREGAGHVRGSGSQTGDGGSQTREGAGHVRDGGSQTRDSGSQARGGAGHVRDGGSQTRDGAGQPQGSGSQTWDGAGQAWGSGSHVRGEGGDARHLTLLVEDGRGWRNLCRLLTRAHAHTRDTADRRAGQPSVWLEQVCEHAEGLVCLTGCAEHGVHEEAACRRLLDAFGPQRLRVELQRPYARGDAVRNRMLERLARRLGVPAVATGDVHAHTPARALLQDALVAARHGLTLDASEVLRRPNHCHVLARPQAMAARFRAYPDAVTETLRLAERLRFDLAGDLGYRYPGSDGTGAGRELAAVCRAELARRYPPGDRNAREAAVRLEQELALIDRLGLSGFFLLHHEILALAREVALEVRGPDSARALLPPGRGRGSSVSSIVCYLTGLSHIDPIAARLALGRFLHEDITGLPDIDIDFPRDIRERLIPAIHDRYGRDRTALVAAFPTFRARGAIRELGKALGLPPGEIERVARGSDGWGGDGAVGEDIATALGHKRLAQGRWAWLARLAGEAQGLPRHFSQHPGGMVLSTRPLIDCCPVVPAAMAGRQMVQWDKDSCADAGFLKIDLLGLGMLSAVERCVELIAAQRGERIDLSRIPFDDPDTFATIQQADTTGVFQIESRAQMASLRRTRPASLEDLTIQVALVRPGPIVGGAVNPYIQRRQALLHDPGYQVPHLHPSLETVLAETLGTIIFQDQVIDVARAFAGFGAGEAESLRRAMSRKRSQQAIDAHRDRFIHGARQTHPDADAHTIEQVWGMVAGFAGFGFPKSHGAAFGLLAYQSTWLRVHHPAEFLCALLNEQPMGFYPPDSLIHEAGRRSIATLPADVNESEEQCTLTQADAIRLGLAYIKGVHEQDIQRLIRSREESGPFQTLRDLAARSGLHTPTLELLAWSGACDALAGGGPYARRNALWQLGIATPANTTTGGHQLALSAPIDTPQLPALAEWEQMIADYAATGVSIERHPIQLLRPQLTQQGARTTAELATTPHASRVTVGGLVIARQRPQTANGITFLLIEDETGTLNVIVPEKLYEHRRLVIRTQPLILIHGRLERHAATGGQINLLAQTVNPLAHAPVAGQVRRLIDQHPGAQEHADETQHAATGTDDFRAVAPPAMNFGRGRRRS